MTDNLFGDILTDLGGAIAGGIGRAASGNLNPDRTGPSLFEPVHGSAPDIAGTGRADPDRRHHLGGHDARLPRRRRTRPPGSPRPWRAFTPIASLSTTQIGDAIAERV